MGAPTEELESAQSFVTDYEAAGFSEPYEAYGAYSYDAAQTIIEAAKVALADADEVTEEVRTAMVEAAAEVEFEGVTGTVSFDEYGDTTNKTLTVYKVEGGKWAPVETGEFEETA